MARRGRQGSLQFPAKRTWGGARRNAGRKPRGAKAMVAHQAREPVSPKEPRHVTLRLLGNLPSLRGKRSYRAVRGAFEAARERLGMRLVHWSVQGNHLHLIVEAKDRLALSRGMQGLKIRLAKALNRLWGRAGSVFSDRYHAVALRTPRQVRSALLYVLNNFRKHEGQRGRRLPPSFVDPLSTALAFDGWKRQTPIPSSWKTKPRTWLLAKGWRRGGLLSEDAVPSTPQ